MSLRLAGKTGTSEEVKSIAYSPGLQDSGDLEPATRSVTATSKPGTADYTASLTVAAPPSPLVVLRLCLRLQATIDSFGGAPAATQLSYAIAVNGVERATGAWTATGARYAAVDLASGQFSLGSANTIQVFLWVDQGEAVVSLCQVWLAAGSAATGATEVLGVEHRGLMALAAYLRVRGTGSPTAMVVSTGLNWLQFADASGDFSKLKVPALVSDNPRVAMYGTVATDLNYLAAVSASLRREE